MGYRIIAAGRRGPRPATRGCTQNPPAAGALPRAPTSRRIAHWRFSLVSKMALLLANIPTNEPTYQVGNPQNRKFWVAGRRTFPYKPPCGTRFWPPASLTRGVLLTRYSISYT